MFGPVSEGMRLFKTGASVAVVGYSEAPHRIVVKVTKYLLEEGNKVTGINPNMGRAKKTDIPIKPRLSDLDQPSDVIQIFRNSDHLPQLADEIGSLKWRPKLVWCQQGVHDMVFQQELEELGISVVMDACPYALRNFL